jgi:hypothetical protein
MRRGVHLCAGSRHLAGVGLEGRFLLSKNLKTRDLRSVTYYRVLPCDILYRVRWCMAPDIIFGLEPSSMSNSTMDDYFAFMSDKWASKDPASRNSMAGEPKKPLRQTDTIDFVDESQIEVIESVVSDTMIERIFKQFKQA